jgi:glycogen phosphorylase
MYPIRSFSVTPALPARLSRLRDLAYNLRWSWTHDTIDLFRRLDRELWETTGHNPVLLLGAINQSRLEQAASDDGFLSHYERVCADFDEYMKSERTWYRRAKTGTNNLLVAYFSAEFGLTECLRTYSGGLGLLAGDHLKSSSDLGIPLVGVGLLYQEGYFRQYLNADGWQGELYPENDFANLPVTIARDRKGDPVKIRLQYPDAMLTAQVWKVQVGRVSLFLLDTNMPENRPYERDITNRLYGGDRESRIRQEILLGIGGIHALDALDLRPSVCHMNEGHSAFLALERTRQLMVEHGMPFADAREASAAQNLFTTHTPVPAGIDMFAPELIDKYFAHYYPSLGLARDQFLALGRKNPGDNSEPFSMAILAVKLAAHTNGVSQLHSETSRRMWQDVWPGVPRHEVPISGVTNGVHPGFWVSAPDLSTIYDRYLGPGWVEDPTDEAIWEYVDRIPSEELWRVHERKREQLVSFARQRLRSQLERRGAPASEIAAAGEVLNPSALTIGFGRRVATYKRGTLLFRDAERLARILNNRDRPVQIIIAGKAHPQDSAAKDLIRQIIHIIRDERFRARIVFLEDYDIVVARHMLQGADVWLNTPRVPEEASGTSGMKAGLNGVLNMSTLDGWWAEAYRPGVGWRIGSGEEYHDLEYHDEVEGNAIYDLLEKEVIPMFYSRSNDDVPRAWMDFVKASIRTIGPRFNTNRMVHEYYQRFYLPTVTRAERLVANGATRAKRLAEWKGRLAREWPKVRIGQVWSDLKGEVRVGGKVTVQANIYLGELRPDDVTVEIYHGMLDSRFEIIDGQAVWMSLVSDDDDNNYVYAGEIPCDTTGQHGYTLRVVPKHDDLSNTFEPRLIHWADARSHAEQLQVPTRF